MNKKPSSSNWLSDQIWSSLWFWMTISCTCLLYWSLYVLDQHRPHYFWWIVTTGAMVVTGFRAFAIYLCTLRTCSRWMLSTAIFMLALTPIIFAAAFITQLNQTAHARGDLRLGAPVKCLGLWITGYFELEARFRYRRITTGNHVELFDDGDVSNPSELVEQMDRHIEAMSEVLGRPTPTSKLAWIRGPLFGHQGRAICMFAICDAGPIESLDYLDRHEIAHTTMFGVAKLSQEPPMLLAEGWAQVSSVDRSELISQLSDEKKFGEEVTIEDMVRAPRYGQSAGPAYSIGGPFVTFLIEKHGGAVFTSLYESALRKTFEQDFESVIGNSLADSETEFWAWLETENNALDDTAEQDDSEIEGLVIANEEDRVKWQAIVDGWKVEREQESLKSLAVEILVVRKELSVSLRSVSDGESVWGSCEYESPELPSEFLMSTSQGLRYVYRDQNGKISNGDDDPQIIVNWHDMAKLNRPNRHLPLFDSAPIDVRYTIEEIETKAVVNGLDCWKIVVTEVWDLNEDESGEPYESRVEVYLDAADHFNVVRSIRTGSREQFEMTYTTKTINGHHFADLTSTSEDGLKQVSTRVLKPAEVKQLKEKCEKTIAKAPVPADQRWWSDLATSPWLWGIGWPILAVVFIAIDLFCESLAVRRWFSKVSR